MQLIRAVSGLDGWWASAAPLPGRMTRARMAPASATAAPTRKAVCIPAAKVAWLR